METVTITEAKAQLSRLVERALHGERIGIGRRGRPEVVLARFEGDTGDRRLGRYDGPFELADDFDDPLPDDVLDGFA